MRTSLLTIGLVLIAATVLAQQYQQSQANAQAQQVQRNEQPRQRQEIPNRLIDYPGFVSDAAVVGKLRAERRLSEADFIRLAADRDTVVLDARSQQKFKLLHVQGAKNLSLPDITAAELAKVIPDKSTRVLIYCNNNFINAPVAFPSKMATTSLNIYTYNVLYGYGYTNVYELGPLLDIKTTKIPFVRAAAIVLK